MKRLILLTVLAALACGCTKNTVIEQGASRAMSFETYVGKGVKSVPVTAFKDGDAVGVISYQTATDWATDGATGEPFMNNLPLKKIGSWVLDVTRYWEKGKKHTFFGYAPYRPSSKIENGTLTDYIVPSKADDQQDFMISIPTGDTKDMVYDGINNPSTVKFEFAHAMSQVRFSAATDFDYSRLYTIAMKSITIRGISNKGNIDLAAPSLSNNPWTNQEAAPIDYAANVSFDTPVAFSDALTPLNDGNVFMLMPQSFTDAQIEFLVHVTNNNAGGPTPTGYYPVTAKITGKWDRNKVYHYEATLDMEQILGVKPIVIGEPSITEWEAEPDKEIFFGVKVEVPDSDPESVEGDIKITKPYAPSSSPMQIENTGSGEEWTATVSSTKAAVDWLTLADDAAGANSATVKVGKDNRTLYIKTTENTTASDRVAYVIVKRKNSMDVIITVKQAKENTDFAVTVAEADKESTATAIKLSKDYRKFSSELKIDNKGSEREWAATITKGSEWLKLADDASGAKPETIKKGTANSTLYITAPENTTTDRTATIIVTRQNSTSVTITVTQTKENTALNVTVSEATGSATAKTLTKTYPVFSSAMIIDNADSERAWTAAVSGGTWLKLADKADGSGQAASKTGTANQTLYIYSPENNTGADRTATVTVSRPNATSVVITVKQTKENTYFKVTLAEADAGGTATAMKLSKEHPLFASPLVIDNTGNERQWTATVSGGSWLTLADNASGGGQATTKTGTTGSKTLYIYAAANSTSLRTATVTISRANTASVVITVTQTSDGVPTDGNLYWAVGNLVADGKGGCKIGKPTDDGLYFQFGSLIGWKGGATGTGEGNTPSDGGWGGWNDMMVAPSKYTAGATTWPNETTNNHYFGHAVSPYDLIGQKLSSFPGWESGGLVSSTVAVGDPCRYYLGGTWRTPTAEEWGNLFRNLYPTGTVGGTWAGLNDWWLDTNNTPAKAHVVVDILPSAKADFLYANTTTTTAEDAAKDPNAICLPCAGYKKDGAVQGSGGIGMYASGSIYNSTKPLTMSVTAGQLFPRGPLYDRAVGVSVRCVHN